MKFIGWSHLNQYSNYLNKENIINLNNSISAIKKKIESSEIKNFDLEIKKSFIRSFIRFSEEAWKFAKYQSDFLIKKEVINDQFYLTMPYILYHSPYDKNESGDFHTDVYSYNKTFITNWTSLDTCHYHPLNIIEYSNNLFNLSRINNKLFKSISKLILPNKKLKVFEGDSFIWTGKMLHRGNFNSSNKDHFAIFMRFTSLPIRNDRTMKIYDFKNKNNDKIPLLNIKNYYQIFDIFIDLFSNDFKEEINFDKNNNLKNYFEKIKKICNKLKLTNFEKRFISFSCSLIGQRERNNHRSLFFHSLATELSEENTVSFYFILNILSLKFKIENKFILDFFHLYIKEKNSAQTYYQYKQFHNDKKLNYYYKSNIINKRFYNFFD